MIPMNQEKPLLTEMLRSVKERIDAKDNNAAAVELRKIGEHMAKRIVIERGLWDRACVDKNGQHHDTPNFASLIYCLRQEKPADSRTYIDNSTYNDVFMKLREYGNRGAHSNEPIEDYEILFVYNKTLKYAEKFCKLFPDAARYGVLPTPTPSEAAPVPDNSAVSQSGKELGRTQYSDVVAKIDGYPIPSYNISGVTYIPAEALPNYGFILRFDRQKKRLTLDLVRAGRPGSYTACFVPPKNTHTAGEPSVPYSEAEYTAWIGEKQISCFSIEGRLCICMDDLEGPYAKEYIWDTETITLNLVTK